jgi:hypothetical protein
VFTVDQESDTQNTNKLFVLGCRTFIYAGRRRWIRFFLGCNTFIYTCSRELDPLVHVQRCVTVTKHKQSGPFLWRSSRRGV